MVSAVPLSGLTPSGSLKVGVVQATSVMRTLQIGDRPTKLAQAVAELGRIDKTIHALTYIDDEAKRRRIPVSDSKLNATESPKLFATEKKSRDIIVLLLE